MSDFAKHLTRQAAFSRATFGPGPRTEGVMDHISKEFQEIRAVYDVNDGKPDEGPDSFVHMQAAEEWVDVAILGLDGLTRAIATAHPYMSFDSVGELAADLIVAKQGRNERRDWPDWRRADPNKAIEHDRSKDDEIPEFK